LRRHIEDGLVPGVGLEREGGRLLVVGRARPGAPGPGSPDFTGS